jgi:hypothetical protein
MTTSSTVRPAPEVLSDMLYGGTKVGSSWKKPSVDDEGVERGFMFQSGDSIDTQRLNDTLPPWRASS